ncbi:MAG TPA: DUF2231 domain-containing protein [Mycobacteriales bacterium]|nr:DUF2231 domain-containing protein [Mycobacteriales bacterium]
MPTEIHGLPAHVLLVHVVVVAVPLAAIMLILAAVWPAARHRMGLAVPIVALVAMISVPITTHAGEWLRDRVRDTSLVDRHAELGDQLLPFAIGVFACAAVVWGLDRYVSRDETTPATSAAAWAVPVQRIVAALAIVVSVFAVVQVYRIGDSGAKAAWHGKFSTQSHETGDSAGGR